MVDPQGMDLLRMCQLWVTITLTVGRPPPDCPSSRLPVQHTSGRHAITAVVCAQGYIGRGRAFIQGRFIILRVTQ